MADAQIQGIEFEIRGNAEAATKSINRFISTLSKIRSSASGIKEVSKHFLSLRNLLSAPFKRAANDVSSLVKGLSGVASSFKRILGYRLIRTVIKEIGQAFSEGTKNVYQWSKAFGGPVNGSMMTFAQTMDDIATSLAYFKNSVGAAIAPLMNMLAPAIRFVTDAAVELLNIINQLFARLTGQSTWTRAIRNATEYGEAVGGAGSAAKEAMRYLAPFDELNVLPDSRGGGGGGGSSENYGGIFEEVASFADGISDFADRVREAINASNWQGLGTLLGDKINSIIDSIDFAGYGAKVGEYINAWFTTEYWTLNTINFQNIGAKIAEFLTGDDGIGGALQNIDFTAIGGVIVETLTALPDIMIGAIDNLDFGVVGKSLGDFIKGVFSNLSTWIDEVDWGELFINLNNGIADFIKGLDILGIATDLLGVLGSIAGAVIEGIGPLLLDVVDSVVDFFTNPDTWTLAKAWFSDNFLRGIAQFGIDAANAITEPVVSGINSLIDDINGLLDKFPALAEKLGVDHLDPISFKLIPDLDPPVGEYYNQVKAEIDAKSKKSPIDIASRAVFSTFTKAFSSGNLTNGKNPILTAQAMFATFTKGFNKGNLTSNGTPIVPAQANLTTFTRNLTGNVTSKGSPILNAIANLFGFQTNFSGNNTNSSGRPILSTVARFVSRLTGQSFSTEFNSVAAFLGWELGTKFINFLAGIDSTANINSYLDNINPEFDAYAKITGAGLDQIIYPNNKVTINATANVTSVSGHPSINVSTKKNGGVYRNGSWLPIQSFAGGGSPFGGQIFRARENGNPELVGTLRGSTAVMNNDQIVASVSAGVARAISGIRFQMSGYTPAVFEAEGVNNGDTEEMMYRAFSRALDEMGDITLDGEVVYRRMVNRNNLETRRVGVNPMMARA